MTRYILCKIVASLFVPVAALAGTTEFCLDGEFDLAARYQGMQPGADEFVPMRWCVVSEDDSDRVLFSARGKSNPDMDGSWTVAFVPPDLVRIVNSDDPPDIEFRGADSLQEAQRVRRLDPRRFVEAHEKAPVEDVAARLRKGRLVRLSAMADMPLRGRVPVVWTWNWADKERPVAVLTVDGDELFRATGSWREIADADAVKLWKASTGAEPVDVPGDRWPSRVAMRRLDVADGIYLVRGVRTGFQHLVVDTSDGLVVVDAPAGWVEFHQVPPSDLVPGLGVSGLSERFVDFLAAEFPGRPIRAVALTHAHDDHAGGARAFAAAGAAIYAPAEYAAFLNTALNRDSMPADRFSKIGGKIEVLAVNGGISLADSETPVQLLSIGPGPHSSAGLGVLAGGHFFVSDVHVPRTEADEPRAERAVTECWFANWALQNLPASTVILNSHSPVETPLSRLAEYLESSHCKQQVD